MHRYGSDTHFHESYVCLMCSSPISWVLSFSLSYLSFLLTTVFSPGLPSARQVEIKSSGLQLPLEQEHLICGSPRPHVSSDKAPFPGAPFLSLLSPSLATMFVLSICLSLPAGTDPGGLLSYSSQSCQAISRLSPESLLRPKCAVLAVDRVNSLARCPRA